MESTTIIMTRTHFLNPLKAFFLALLLLASSILFAQEPEAIGRVITVQGEVQARSSTGGVRQLRRGSEFFVLETILTAEDSETQLRFNDSALVTLGAETEFSIDEYVSDGLGGAADSMVISLVKGGLRTISGSIGDDAQDDYRLETPFASIGIRGTEYEVQLADGGRAIVAVFDGTVTVALPGGGPVRVLGIDGEADALEVNEDEEVILLEELPEEVGNLIVQLVSGDDVLALPEVEAEDEIVIEEIIPIADEVVEPEPEEDTEVVVPVAAAEVINAVVEEASGGPEQARVEPVSPN